MVLMSALGLGGSQLAIGVGAGLATLAGGALALRLGRHLPKLVGFGCGAVIGVALTDLLPEALELGGKTYSPLALTTLTGVGFMAYVLIDRMAELLGERSARLARHLGPASLVLHSLMDGLGIGVAFSVSAAAGLVVAMAVLAHDILDGANTITLSLARDLGRAPTRRWLALDAAAPLAGILLSRTIKASPQTLAPLLAVFAGMFLYIGAAQLLPRSRTNAVGLSGAVATVLGAAFVLGAVLLSSPA